MQLKLFLNKVLKVDNIEYYSLGSLMELRKAYVSFLETSGGSDPDFPMLNFGNNSKGSSESYSKSNNLKHMEEIMGENEVMDNIPFPETTLNLTR